MALLVAIVVAVLTFTNWGQIQRARPATPGPSRQGSLGYVCGDPTKVQLCNGQNIWEGSFDGARTSVTVRAASPGDGCVLNAEELIQATPVAYIEAGYEACQNLPDVAWFWGEKKPGSGQLVARYFGPVLRTDLGWPASIDIHRAGPQAFAIRIVAHSGAVVTGTSGGYALNPIAMRIGTSVSGTRGAHQDATTYANNQYQAAGDQSWSYQRQDGFTYLAAGTGPVYARWQGLPPSSSLRGGVFVTCVGETC